MIKPHQTYLDTLSILPEHFTSSADLRCTLTGTLKTLLQQTNHTLITPAKPTPNLETFLNTLKTHPNIYQASLSRQFATDLPPDIEQTTLKDEPKDWYIKTADFGDDCDRAQTCDRSFADNIPTRQDCALLLAAKQTIFDLLENILEIAAPESL